MEIDEAADIVWSVRQAGRRSPAELRDALTVDEAYRVQAEVTRRILAGGARLTGWKIAGNSDRFRTTYPGAEPMRGPLFDTGFVASGTVIDLAPLSVLPRLESELCFRIDRPLAGTVSRDDVVAAVGAVWAAYEMPCVMKADGVDVVAAGALDLPACIADHVNNLGYVLGDVLEPYPADFPLADVFAEERCNGELSQSGVIRESVDDLLDSIAWLAAHLARSGDSIEAGQLVLGGNCLHAAVHVAPGEGWETTFSGVGSVSIEFR
jgi:2-keto-4-pentenoate hydratase